MPDFSALTPREFVEWTDRAGRHELTEALCALTDADRKRFAKETAAAHKSNRSAEGSSWRLDLALAATCSWTEVKRIDRGFALWQNSLEGTADDLITIIAARKPDWVDRFIQRELEGDFTRWSAVRRLVREGIAPRPASDAYIQKMISTHAGAWGHRDRETHLIDRLHADPGLLEDEIWRLFEIDPSEGSLFSYDEASWGDGRNSWGKALLSLATEGAIDRWKLLQASHETLRRGIQAKDTAFHLRLIERLNQTKEERAALSDTYLDLLGHRVDVVVRFALASCESLVKEGALAPRVVLERITPALQREKKGPAEAALKLIRRVAKNDPSLAHAVAEVAGEALRHPDSGIHERALDLIEELGVPTALKGRIDEISPSQRARAEALAGAGTHQRDSADELDPQDVIARARALDYERRVRFGIEPLLASLERGEDPPRHVPAENVPRLTQGEVRPITNFTELIDVLLLVIDGRPSPIEIERALDGFSRLAANRPQDYRERTAAMLKSATGVNTGFSESSAAADEIKRMIALWLRGGVSPSNANGVPEEFLSRRVYEIVRRVADKRSAPLLALPTHGSWIDPRRLVERMQEYALAATPIGTLDLVQALLRVAPDHREEALAASAALRGEEGAAVRYALGGDLILESNTDADTNAPTGLWSSISNRFRTRFSAREQETSRNADPRERVKPAQWPLWAAASRARLPFEDDPNLAGTPAATSLTMAAGPASYRWSIRVHKQAFAKSNDYFIDVVMSPDRGPNPDWPLSLFGCKGQRWIFGSSVDAHHRSTIRPIDPTPALIAGIHSIVDRMFRPASAFTPTAAYLEVLLDPHAPVGEIAELALALALVAQDADARTMAIDVVIAVMADGRLRGEELGRVYSRLWASDGFLKLGRVALAAQTIARESPVHQVGCARMLEEFLASLQPPAPKDLHQLLGAYRELLAGSKRGCDPRLETLLLSVAGSGKTTKLAREIVATTGRRVADPAVSARILHTRLVIAGA